MGIRSKDFDDYSDDADGIEAGLFGSDDDMDAEGAVRRVNKKGKGSSRWRSVEEYREWKRLKSQLGDDEDLDWDH
jgi:hypothetical protein